MNELPQNVFKAVCLIFYQITIKNELIIISDWKQRKNLNKNGLKGKIPSAKKKNNDKIAH